MARGASRDVPVTNNMLMTNAGVCDGLETCLEWLGRLVAFDTTSRNSNLALIEMVETYVQSLGIASHRVPNAEGTKANLYFSVGEMVPGGVILSGHTDVVPVDGQDWHSDPWTIRLADGKVYGRGTADMKSFLALALEALPRMQAAGLKRPVHFALSYDEEIGLLGAPAMIRELAGRLPLPCAVIVGEPTEMQVVERHKGILGLRTAVTGHEAHSSQTHLGISANMVAVRLMAKIDALAQALAGADTGEDEGLTPAHTTMTIGLVEGGSAPNILAGRCQFYWDIRPAPGENPHALLDAFNAFAHQEETAMQSRFPSCSITTEILSDVPGLHSEPMGAAGELAARLTGANARHAASYVAEAGQFQQAGFSTVICGPGSIAQAHQPNEFITLEQLRQGKRFMTRLIEELAL